MKDKFHDVVEATTLQKLAEKLDYFRDYKVNVLFVTEEEEEEFIRGERMCRKKYVALVELTRKEEK